MRTFSERSNRECGEAPSEREPGWGREIITGLRVPESAFSPEIRTQMRSLPFFVIVLKNNRDSGTQNELSREWQG